VFNASSGRVTGFLVDVGGLFSKARFLPAGQVKSLGADALTVPGADVLGETNPAENDPNELEGRPLGGRPVMSASGTVLGKVSDVTVDTDTLTVPDLILSTGLIDNALHGKPRLPLTMVKTVGKDSIVVPDDYDPKTPDNPVPA
jgi:uncharacterized protein YrrD